MSLDFEQFDSHRSLCDLNQFAIYIGSKTSIFSEHMRLESYAYPLIYGRTGQVILSEANRLMSGHYLTSAFGT